MQLNKYTINMEGHHQCFLGVVGNRNSLSKLSRVFSRSASTIAYEAVFYVINPSMVSFKSA